MVGLTLDNRLKVT